MKYTEAFNIAQTLIRLYPEESFLPGAARAAALASTTTSHKEGAIQVIARVLKEHFNPRLSQSNWGATMIREDRDNFKLSSGRSFYACSGRLGMSDRFELTYGYDGIVYLPWDGEGEQPQFTLAERSEIANYMITLWNDWVTKAAS